MHSPGQLQCSKWGLRAAAGPGQSRQAALRLPPLPAAPGKPAVHPSCKLVFSFSSQEQPGKICQNFLLLPAAEPECGDLSLWGSAAGRLDERWIIQLMVSALNPLHVQVTLLPGCVAGTRQTALCPVQASADQMS